METKDDGLLKTEAVRVLMEQATPVLLKLAVYHVEAFSRRIRSGAEGDAAVIAAIAEAAFFETFMPRWREHTGVVKRGGAKAPHYMAFIAQHVCHFCGDPRVQVHHEPLKGMGGGRGCDYETIPLCRLHHDNRHGKGSRSEWESRFGEGSWDARPSYDDMKSLCEAARVQYLVEYIQRREG